MLLLVSPLAQWLGNSYTNTPKSHTHSDTHTHRRIPKHTWYTESLLRVLAALSGTMLQATVGPPKALPDHE